MKLVIVESPTKVPPISQSAMREVNGRDPATFCQDTIARFASGYKRDPRPLYTRSARKVAGQKPSPSS